MCAGGGREWMMMEDKGEEDEYIFTKSGRSPLLHSSSSFSSHVLSEAVSTITVCPTVADRQTKKEQIDSQQEKKKETTIYIYNNK